MKAATLASLLVTSAAAGAAAAGGPFWFAYTTPIALYEASASWAGSQLAFPTQSGPMVITDISCPHGGTATFTLRVNGVDSWVWNMETGGYSGPRDGQIHLEHGIPVPAGAQVTISRSGNFQPPMSIGGYLF